jgi:imidazole glycerol-phosphate synthase subunit HisH
VSLVIGVCDYGVGNLRSVERALRASNVEVVISDEPDTIAACAGVVLPGVGAFAIAAKALHDRGLGEAVRHVASTGGTVLGVCLGHQLLFEHSDEGPGGDGLGLLRGEVGRLAPGTGLKVPHMGWNTLTSVASSSTLLAGVSPGSYMYFVHSYAAVPVSGDVAATTDYGGIFAAAVESGNITGTQFHPEKSGAGGLRVYANFVAACAARASAGRAS